MKLNAKITLTLELHNTIPNVKKETLIEDLKAYFEIKKSNHVQINCTTLSGWKWKAELRNEDKSIKEIIKNNENENENE